MHSSLVDQSTVTKEKGSLLLVCNRVNVSTTEIIKQNSILYPGGIKSKHRRQIEEEPSAFVRKV